MQTTAASLTAPLLLLLAAAAASGQHPSTKLFKCKLLDKECLKNYLQNDVIRRFSKGFPESEVKSLDPLAFAKIDFSYKVAPGLRVRLVHTDAAVHGLSDTRVLEVRPQLNGSRFYADVVISVPKLFYEGSYASKAEVLLVPVSWNGVFNMTLEDITDTWKLTADLVKKGDETFLNLKNFLIDPKISAFHTYATGLFWGNEEAGRFALKAVNEYWRSFYDLMWKFGEQDITSKVMAATEGIFSMTPIARTASGAFSRPAFQIIPPGSYQKPALHWAYDHHFWA
ncbi:uncharacterized protein LOC134530266 [Bacillus rossius redtenbacheri]|uniref:uncharacterized protein LOC134530266 n=1 Tax=Bacillus rossius redtenbacheri TaxID=93214 RepID=UPI002FDD8419